MSKNKISINSNNSYAQALFELANEESSLKKIEEQVLALSKLINVSEEFRYLIKNPTTSLDDLIQVMETISEKNAGHKGVRRFTQGGWPNFSFQFFRKKLTVIAIIIDPRIDQIH